MIKVIFHQISDADLVKSISLDGAINRNFSLTFLFLSISLCIYRIKLGCVEEEKNMAGSGAEEEKKESPGTDGATELKQTHKI